jgi:hypothetical protein
MARLIVNFAVSGALQVSPVFFQEGICIVTAKDLALAP